MNSEQLIIKTITKMAINKEYRKYLVALKQVEDLLSTEMRHYLTNEESDRLYVIRNEVTKLFYVSITTAHSCVDCKEDNTLSKNQWKFSGNIRCQSCTIKKMDEIKKELS